jgi:hypothetical protein
MSERDQEIASFGTKKVTLALPIPVNDRLDELVEKVKEEGGQTTRQEMAAMLIYFATLNGTMNGEMLKVFRTATVAEMYE